MQSVTGHRDWLEGGQEAWSGVTAAPTPAISPTHLMRCAGQLAMHRCDNHEGARETTPHTPAGHLVEGHLGLSRDGLGHQRLAHAWGEGNRTKKQW